MKKSLLILSIISLCLISQAQARTNISLAIHSGVPIYAQPAPYYNRFDEPYWRATPTRVIIVNNTPHRMHHWRGRWYDESWSQYHPERPQPREIRHQSYRWDHQYGQPRRW